METRLGDIIDDFCIKCKRIMNHAVVSILDGGPAKVRCRTCYNDHDYRHELAPPPKVDPRKAALFKEVLAKIPGSGEPPVSVVQETVEAAAVGSEGIPAAVLEDETPKAKAKARGRK
jgi:hypothetical protein